MNRTLPPPARRVLAAYAIGLGPAALLGVLLFGGQVVTPCLALQCPPPSDGPIPIIGTASGSRVTVAVLTAAWVLALLGVSRSVIREGKRRILGLLARAGTCGIALGVVAASLELVSGVRLRTVASTGVVVSVIVAVAIWTVAGSIAAWRSNQ